MGQNIKKGWDAEFAASTLTDEDGGVYGAGVATVDATTTTSGKGFLAEKEWADEQATDKEEVTGLEHGSDQEITEKRTGGTITFPKGQAHWMAFFAAAVLGPVAAVQDAANSAWLHSFVPVVEGTNLPSWQIVHSIGGRQRTYAGCKGNSLKISGEENGYISAELAWLGDGSRAPSAETFPAKPLNNWVPYNQPDIFLESGANIAITAAGSRVQAAENISSATPETLNERVKSFEFTFSNNLEMIPGAGGAGLLQNLEYGRRTVEGKITMRFKDQTEMDYYLNQDALAIEINAKGAQIDSGAFFEGFILIIPRFKLKAPPVSNAGPGDIMEVELDMDIQDDGTNAAFILDVFNATETILA